jgi:hypothetical protein
MRVKAVLSGGGPTRIRPTRGPRVKEPAPFFFFKDTLRIPFLKTEKMSSKVPMRLNESNARNDCVLAMFGGNVWRTLVRFTYILPKSVF